MKFLRYASKLEEKIKLSPYENNSLVTPSKFLKRMTIENLLLSVGITTYYNLSGDTIGSGAMLFFLIYNISRWNSLTRKLQVYKSNSDKQELQQ